MTYLALSPQTSSIIISKDSATTNISLEGTKSLNGDSYACMVKENIRIPEELATAEKHAIIRKIAERF